MWVDAAMPAIAEAHLLRDNTHVFLMNKTELLRRMNAVRDAFATVASPQLRIMHTFAVKANPLQAVLEVAVHDADFGLETASMGEFALAERVCGAGARSNGNSSGSTSVHDSSHHPHARIVFDSPAKTMDELAHAVQQPCYLNVDNFDELERIVALARGTWSPTLPPLPIRATIGIRINPQTVTRSDNAALATGGAVSKFGVSLRDGDNADKIRDYIARYHDEINLRMVHVHSGSQGLSLDTMVAGVRAIVEEIVTHPRVAALVTVVDIGGGLPVDFAHDDDADNAHTGVSPYEYVAALRKHVPALFAPPTVSRSDNSNGGSTVSVAATTTAAPPQRLLITEFGRSIAAKAGVLMSRIEYVKQSGGRQIVLQHVGADLAVRTVWQPDKWPLRVSIFDEHGRLRACGSSADNGGGDATTEVAREACDTALTDVGGPCCNSGCTIARAVAMPGNVRALRDFVVVRDVGAYYHSSFSLYNLRQMPACYVCETDEQHHVTRLTCVRAAQTVEDTIAWFLTSP